MDKKRSRRAILAVWLMVGLALLLAMPGSLVLSQGGGEKYDPEQDPTRAADYGYWQHSSGRIFGMTRFGGIILWEAPPGTGDHIWSETWVVCHYNGVAFVTSNTFQNSIHTGWSYSQPGGATHPGKLISGNTLQVVTNHETSDHRLKITNIVTWKATKDEIRITMKVRNLTGGAVPIGSVKRWGDVDVQKITTNIWTVSSRSVTGSINPFSPSFTFPAYQVTLSAIGPLADFWYPWAAIDEDKNDTVDCQTDDSALPPFIGDAAASIEWRGLQLPAGETRTFKALYKIIK